MHQAKKLWVVRKGRSRSRSCSAVHPRLTGSHPARSPEPNVHVAPVGPLEGCLAGRFASEDADLVTFGVTQDENPASFSYEEASHAEITPIAAACQTAGCEYYELSNIFLFQTQSLSRSHEWFTIEDWIDPLDDICGNIQEMSFVLEWNQCAPGAIIHADL